MGQNEDLIAAIRQDHEEVKALFADVQAASSPDAKREAFQCLVHKLAVHETAEEEIVHPLVRKAQGGDAIADQRLQEENQAKQELADLEKLGVDAPTFAAKFDTFHQAVLEHAEHEEQEEHPKIQQSVDADRLRQLGKAFGAAKAMAPTHPHPHGPESAIGNLVVGPVVSIMDRARDAVRDAMEKIRT